MGKGGYFIPETKSRNPEGGRQSSMGRVWKRMGWDRVMNSRTERRGCEAWGAERPGMTRGVRTRGGRNTTQYRTVLQVWAGGSAPQLSHTPSPTAPGTTHSSAPLACCSTARAKSQYLVVSAACVRARVCACVRVR